MTGNVSMSYRRADKVWGQAKQESLSRSRRGHLLRVGNVVLWTVAHVQRGVAQIMLTSFNVRSLNVMCCETTSSLY